MTLTTEEVRNIAHLARLQINDTDVEQYTNELSKILDVFEQMKAHDTTNILPMAHPMDAVQRLRPDVVNETNQREKFQAIAPDVEQRLYRVPKVIE
ncbi:MAG: aspartyl-tRNA(Asn)/glutamyl-tRNA(Gln) amidotransferase subunit C [Candidatus Azotimanducaceae bacterium]|jgi:aspartyl-tRNA(Asn)/glutamyl-tRNA(Gln) amidotransferase subunit C